ESRLIEDAGIAPQIVFDNLVDEGFGLRQCAVQHQGGGLCQTHSSRCQHARPAGQHAEMLQTVGQLAHAAYRVKKSVAEKGSAQAVEKVAVAVLPVENRRQELVQGDFD